MIHRPLILSASIIVATTFVAYSAGVGVDRLLGGNEVAGSAVVALVVAGLFGLRPAHGLTSFALVVLFADTVEWWSGSNLPYVDESLILLLGLTLLTVHRSRLTLVRPGWREALLLSVFVLAIVSSLSSDVAADVWVPGLGLLAKSFAFFYLTAMLRVEYDDVRPILGVLFAVAVLIVAIGAVEFLARDPVRDFFHLPAYARERGGISVVTSLFMHPALYGWMGVFAGLGLIARFAVLGDRWALVLGTLFSGASLLSGRRAPILGLMAGLSALIARQHASRLSLRRTVGPIAPAVVLVALVALPVLGRLFGETLAEYVEPPELIAEVLSEDPDPAVLVPMAPRNALYVGSVAAARDYFPLGAGLGQFGSHMSRVQYSPVYAEYGLNRIWGLSERHPMAITDTFWPMILGETGVFGLVAMFAFLMVVLRDLWRLAGQSMAPASRAFVLGALLVYVDALARSLTSGVFVAPPIAYFVFGAAGLALAVGRTEGPHSATVEEAPPS